MGSPQMNFINVSIAKSDNGYAMVFGKYNIKIPAAKCKDVDLSAYVGKGSYLRHSS